MTRCTSETSLKMDPSKSIFPDFHLHFDILLIFYKISGTAMDIFTQKKTFLFLGEDDYWREIEDLESFHLIKAMIK